MGEAPIFFKIFFAFGIMLFIAIFVFVLMMIFGTKTKSKLLSRQVKSISDATGMSKEDLESMLTNLQSVSIKSRKRALEENEEDLKLMADKNAEINKDAIKTTASAIKEGLTKGDSMYCKYCGASIDSDSSFCKSCGKKVS